jgi:hypothetical protein
MRKQLILFIKEMVALEHNPNIIKCFHHLQLIRVRITW